MQDLGARRIGAASVIASVLFIFACRDAAEPFRPADRRTPVDASLVRLTFGPGDDRAPAWSSGSDSVYFTTSLHEANTLAPATVLSIAADGMGSISTLIRNVQEGVGRTNWIAAPALSDEGQRLAFVFVRPLLDESPCNGDRMCPVTAELPMVRLVGAEVHARSIDATSGLDDDVVLRLRFAGHSTEVDAEAPGGVITVSEYHPFQFVFETTRRGIFRPSWSPDGNELVVSDGLRLLRWTLGAADPVAVPGTHDGILPAWSPDGAWIAYARYARVDSQTFVCEYQNVYPPHPPEYPPPPPPPPVTDCIERRTIHYASAPEIVVVRPDGSEERVLGQGTDPAWSHDGLHVYASVRAGAEDRIARMSVAGGAATLLPGTEGGIEPAVSRDGRRLAFARGSGHPEVRTHDIWVVELP